MHSFLINELILLHQNYHHGEYFSALNPACPDLRRYHKGTLRATMSTTGPAPQSVALAAQPLRCPRQSACLPGPVPPRTGPPLTLCPQPRPTRPALLPRGHPTGHPYRPQPRPPRCHKGAPRWYHVYEHARTSTPAPTSLPPEASLPSWPRAAQDQATTTLPPLATPPRPASLPQGCPAGPPRLPALSTTPSPPAVCPLSWLNTAQDRATTALPPSARALAGHHAPRVRVACSVGGVCKGVGGTPRPPRPQGAPRPRERWRDTTPPRSRCRRRRRGP